MGSIDVYLKIFFQKLMNILGSPDTKPQKKKKREYSSLTSVPAGYTLKLQGKDVCDGKAVESGKFQNVEIVSKWGDPKSLVMMNRARELCDTNKKCNFISVWKTGEYSVFDECASSKYDPMNTSITLQNTSFVAPSPPPRSRSAVAAPDNKTPPPPPPPPPTPPPPPPPPPSAPTSSTTPSTSSSTCQTLTIREE